MWSPPIGWFQSTLPYGERPGHRETSGISAGFNPRSRTGSDRRGELLNYVRHCFNPHSRTGSDLSTGSYSPRTACFNPRSRTGSDPDWRIQDMTSKGFNPRSRTGSDAHSCTSPSLEIGFNPRSHTGSDTRLSSLNSSLSVSIHAPVRGATRPSRGRYRLPGVSIHAPVRGATNRSATICSLKECFNPRSRTGSDFEQDAANLAAAMFQSTLPYGERLDHTLFCVFGK